MTSTTSKIFLDTNVLVYAVDGHFRKKRALCRDLISEVTRGGRAVISTQVLQEFFVVATKKLGIDPLDAKHLMKSFENMEIVTVTPRHIGEAVDCSVLNRISFWDALIVVCAESAACDLLATEDLSDGQIIRGVRISNPVGKA